jgi:phage replication O-like protein O
MFKVNIPNFTQLPNQLSDEWLKYLNFVELKVLLVILRKTFGWHKVRDRISLSQLEHITGAKRPAILRAAKTLHEKGLITKEVTGKKGTQQTYYELVINKDSNISYQYDEHTSPSMMNIPTKETLPKEKKKDIPLTPKGDSVSFRKRMSEKKKEVAPRVFVSESQQADLLKKVQEDKEKLVKCYDKLSTWKIGKMIEGGSNDYSAIVKWVIDAVRKDETKKKEADPSEVNKKFAQRVAEKYPHLVKSLELQVGRQGIEFTKGQYYLLIKYEENGFREQVINKLRKMNLKIDGL